MTADAQPVRLDELAIVVVNYDSHQLLERNLSATVAAAAPGECVVVDAFSSSQERHALGAVCERHGWRLIAQDTNPGFGASANAGAEVAIELGCQQLLFLNPDATIDAESMRLLVGRLSNTTPQLIAPRILRPDGSVWFDGAVTDRRRGVPGHDPGPGEEIRWLTGACLAASASTWQQLGGFDDDYFMYFEDVDLSYRCVQSGGEVIVVADATAIHDVGATQAGTKSALYVRYCCRNRLLFAAKHLERRDLARWLVASPRASWRIARRGIRRRHLAHSARLVAAMVVGTAQGCGHALGSMVR